MTMRGTICALVGIVLVAISCHPPNPPLSRLASGADRTGCDDPDAYCYEQVAAADVTHASDTNFIIVTLSGGGTRAAAFAFGVLSQLRETTLPGGDSLLDQVDVISSVSGGSFAAAYVGLFGWKKFFADFRDAVLLRPIERDLLLRVIAPWNWPQLLSPWFGRTDLAAEYYDAHIFEGKRFADMPRRLPFVILNATDISLGAQFSFTQEHFDRLCSDLSGVKVARAVAASSAFPVVFSPITLRNYPRSQCGYTEPDWVSLALKEDFDIAPERYDRARSWAAYADATQRPYVHLSDGGLSDNIGLRAPDAALTTSDPEWSLLRKLRLGTPIKRIIVIVVDAKPRTTFNLDRHASPPSIFSVLNAAATNPMENYSADTVERLRDQFTTWTNETNGFEDRKVWCQKLAGEMCGSDSSRVGACRARCLEVVGATEDKRPAWPNLFRVHVRFEAARGEARSRLEGIATRLQLAEPDVDFLINSARSLLVASTEYQRLLKDLGASTTTPPSLPGV